MIERGDYRQVRDALLAVVKPVETEYAALEQAAGRVLAQDVIAQEDIPAFARSPYDGYAFRAEDVAEAAADDPVTLRIIDYIPAGEMPHTKILPGTAAHLMTGAPVPEGANAVLPFERTVFTKETVTIREPAAPGSNVILPGEDVRRGSVVAHRGSRIDAGLAGTLAGQGVFCPEVFRVPCVGVISTGAELLEEGEELSPGRPGRIYDSNRYSLQAACSQAGCRSVFLGTGKDDPGRICALLQEAVRICDAVLVSGGVSVGDFDCTPAAMERAGIRILARGVALKPGMAGAYGTGSRKIKYGGLRDAGKPGICSKTPCREEKDGRCTIPVFGLSGNPAACMTGFYAIALPVLRRRMGLTDVLPPLVRVRLGRNYTKKRPTERLLRGRIDPGAVTQAMDIFEKQGNQVLSSLAGANAFAILPPDTALSAADEAEAFLIDF